MLRGGAAHLYNTYIDGSFGGFRLFARVWFSGKVLAMGVVVVSRCAGAAVAGIVGCNRAFTDDSR